MLLNASNKYFISLWFASSANKKPGADMELNKAISLLDAIGDMLFRYGDMFVIVMMKAG